MHFNVLIIKALREFPYRERSSLLSLLKLRVDILSDLDEGFQC